MAVAAAALTEQQGLAITTRDVSVALSAGAGCGKTFVLTRRFLSHLEPGPEPADLSRLVAITYTERAAREMRDRIRGECARRLRECPPEEVDHWLRLVRQLDTARVDTFHAYCGRLLRGNAVEAGIDPGFKQLDEMESSTIRRHAVEGTVRRLLSDQNADVIELVYEHGLDGTENLIQAMIEQRHRLEIEAWVERTPEELIDIWRTHWRDVGLPRLLHQLHDCFEAQRVFDFFDRETPKLQSLVDRLAKLREDWPRLLEERDAAEALLVELREGTMFRGATVKHFSSPDAKAEALRSLTKLREVIDDYKWRIRFPETHALTAAASGLHLLRVTAQALDDYDAAKLREGGLDFDDLLLLTRKLLRRSDHVRQRMSAAISLLMVDEFQDTDPLLTEIVRALCGDDLLSGKLFFVGDHKQSIYRFRRAEPKVFHQLRGELPDKGRLPLSQNFRSQPAILNFVNAVFEDVLAPEYEPLQPHHKQLTPQPVIEFLFSCEDEGVLESGDKDDAESGGRKEDGDGRGAPARRRTEAEWIARRLQFLLHDGVPRVREKDALRPVQKKDIVLLFRSMSDVRYYEEALRKQNLEYYVIGGRAFYAQQEVYDVVNLCRAIQNVDDQVSLIGVLRSPFFGLSDDTLFALWSEHHDFEKALRSVPPAYLSERQRDQVQHASQVLSELRANKDRMPSHTLLEHAIARTGYDASLLAEFLGPRKLANLRKLLDTARSLDRAGVFTMADLVEHLQGAVTTEPREALAATHPETSDVIRLMSIHQSKGLEFPVVVVVDMDRRPNTMGPRAVFDPDLGPLVRLPPRFEETRENPGMLLHQQQEADENLAETYRLLYVATTRAADILLLSARMAKADEFESPWMNLLHRKFDLRTGQPRASVLLKHSKTLPEIRCHSQPPDVVPVEDSTESHRLPLVQLREALDGEPDDPDVWPLLARPLPPHPAALRRFSVSLLETIDEDLDTRPLSAKGRLFQVRERLRVRAKYTVHQDHSGVTPLKGREPEWLGSIVHAVLEQADFGQDEDIPKMVDAAILSGEFDVSQAVRDAAVRSVTALLASPLAKELATARRCYRELEFLLNWPDDRLPRLVAGTIDCLFETNDGQWVVFDYKTKVLPAGTKHDELLREYELQLGVYCLAVKEMLGRLPDRVELVLIRDGVQRISLVPTEEFTRHIADRVREAMDAAAERGT